MGYNFVNIIPYFVLTIKLKLIETVQYILSDYLFLDILVFKCCYIFKHLHVDHVN